MADCSIALGMDPTNKGFLNSVVFHNDSGQIVTDEFTCFAESFMIKSDLG